MAADSVKMKSQLGRVEEKRAENFVKRAAFAKYGPSLVRVRQDIPAGMRHEMIEQTAYLRAEQRGFQPGFELEDWLAAEQEVDNLLRERYR